ncbi:hypothetical protein ACLI09_01450 [Flavobacterium sp. RHBU_24]|uniref:hypothetical protein n=1 Tax=Flavobacterium sp. RHBU_24 TaxID=3391185 RepID=UPI003984B7D2
MKIRLLLLIVIALSLTACEKKPQTVTIKNKYSVDLPSFLTATNELNKDASLQYQNGAREFYVVVIDEPRKTFDDLMKEGGLGYGPDLDGYSRLLVDSVRDKLGDKDKRTPTTEKINGLDARLTSLTGTVQNINVYWRVAYVQGRKDYYQILCWTLTENKDKYDNQMVEIIKSFKEVNKSRK